MRILVIQHDADKGLGLFVLPLAGASLELDVQFAGHGELALVDHDGVIALPGVANPDEDSLAIAATRALLGDALRRDLPVLGICLGAELLAEAAGGVTHPCEPEWGYREVVLEPPARDDVLMAGLPARFEVFQAHHYGFGVPPGAVALARAGGAVQAFRIGTRAWGVQFHPEPTLDMLDGWTRALGHLMAASGVDPEATRQRARLHVPAWSERAAAMGSRFAAVVRAGASAPAQAS